MRLRKIMLIDDNEIDLFINKKHIERDALVESIVCKESGLSALEYLRTVGLDCAPDFILLDVKMPGMDGFGFLEQFCGISFCLNPSPKVIMVTSSNSMEDIRRAKNYKACGVIDYLEKPLSEEKVKYLSEAFFI
jgi:CheY-like chemotaxis protein